VCELIVCAALAVEGSPPAWWQRMPGDFSQPSQAISLLPLRRAPPCGRRSWWWWCRSGSPSRFYGCATFSDAIRDERPGVLLVPLRGASPMGWMVADFLRHSAEMPTVVHLPIGTHTYVIEDARGRREVTSGLRAADKARIVAETIAELASRGLYQPVETKLMLVDEVQYGSTITDAARHILTSMDSHGDVNPLRVFAFRDGRTRDRWTRKYIQIASKLNANSLGTTVPSLFTVDRRPLLDAIVNTAPDHPPTPKTLAVSPNVDARGSFAAIFETWQEPQKVLDRLSMMDRASRNQTGSSRVTDEIARALADPIPVRNGKAATREQMVAFFRQLAKIFLNDRTSRRSDYSLAVDPSR
jgi:hypothetical protein